MKKYIKPNTDIHSIELQLMNPATTGIGGGGVNVAPRGKDFEIENNTPSSPNLWDEEE